MTLLKIIPAFAMLSTVALASGAETTTLPACNVSRACTLETGPFNFAIATVQGREFTQRGNQNTCCQLSGPIQKQICDAGLESQGVVVSCSATGNE